MAESEGDDRAPARPPISVLRAAAIVATEGVAVLALGPILVIGGIIMSQPESSARAWAEVVMALAAGALILFLARELYRASLWSRGPVVVIQILALPVGYSLAIGSGQPWYGIPLLAAAASVLYLLATPESRLVFYRE
ncbi:MAG: hypothetical protein M3400_12305 [Actinomycetota bacterium]|nr:hypothetical protein [Actinomycetota bacterium]